MSSAVLHDDLPPAPQGAAPDDPARVSLAATTAGAADLTGEARAAFWRGVEAGRTETAQRPDGVVLVFEATTPMDEQARLTSLLAGLRGVAAALPAGGPQALREQLDETLREAAESSNTIGELRHQFAALMAPVDVEAEVQEQAKAFNEQWKRDGFSFAETARPYVEREARLRFEVERLNAELRRLNGEEAARPAPLTEAEARAWGTWIEKRTRDTGFGIQRDAIAGALLVASRGDIPPEVRPREHTDSEACPSCTDILGAPPPCTVTHDASPGAYLGTFEGQAIREMPTAHDASPGWDPVGGRPKAPDVLAAAAIVEPWRPKVGARVRTADRLTGSARYQPSHGRRRNASGEVLHQGAQVDAWWVRVRCHGPGWAARGGSRSGRPR
jgi:hypothetical protein